jgi:hypothetical protein
MEVKGFDKYGGGLTSGPCFCLQFQPVARIKRVVDVCMDLNGVDFESWTEDELRSLKAELEPLAELIRKLSAV